MPWRGPTEPGEFPTLGYQVGQWIESNIVIPDGYRAGERYLLTDEMWRFLIHFYRLYPWSEPWPSPDALRYTGAQLRRVQKWGKDPFGAAQIWAEALGPTRFAGWDANGEPVGAPYPTPLIVCIGTSEAQTANTWDPVLAMGRRGPLYETAGLDIGQTRILLPGGGKVEPATTSSKARLGAPMTFVTITESHLFTAQGGYRKICGNVKRNVAGMDGRWLELTNGYDPTELSEAQVTATSGDERVYVDTIEPHRVDDLSDTEAVYRELLRQYGDSSRERGGWVNVRGRILSEVQSVRHLEPDRRRYFLNEIVQGMATFVDMTRWDAMARDDDPLRPGEAVGLGFDGSHFQDASGIVACRLRDGRLFTLGVWERPAGLDRAARWRVPSAEVDARMRDAFAAYEVSYLFYDPYRWQDYGDAWSADFPDQVVEFPTNVEQRMDAAIERFITAFNDGQVTHDGHPVNTQHVRNTVLVKGSRKKPRPSDDDDDDGPKYYMKMAKKGEGQLIDLSVTDVLAYAARGLAIEKGALLPPEPAQPFFVAFR